MYVGWVWGWFVGGGLILGVVVFCCWWNDGVEVGLFGFGGVYGVVDVCGGGGGGVG